MTENGKTRKTREEALKFYAEALKLRDAAIEALKRKRREREEKRAMAPDRWAEKYPEAAREFEALDHSGRYDWIADFLLGDRGITALEVREYQHQIDYLDEKYAPRFAGGPKDYEYEDEFGVVRSVLDP